MSLLPPFLGTALESAPARTVLAGLNHLLGQAAWGRDRLKPHAGRRLRLELGPVRLALAVDEEGLFRAEEGEGEADVAIVLPADAPLRLLRGGVAEVMKGAQVTGNADLAETVGFVLRNLRWDAEEDLSRVVGDIAAHRIAEGGARLAAWQKDAAGRIAENIGEYLRHESPQLVRRDELSRFGGEVEELGKRLEALERRLAKRP